MLFAVRFIMLLLNQLLSLKPHFVPSVLSFDSLQKEKTGTCLLQTFFFSGIILSPSKNKV